MSAIFETTSVRAKNNQITKPWTPATDDDPLVLNSVPGNNYSQIDRREPFSLKLSMKYGQRNQSKSLVFF